MVEETLVNQEQPIIHKMAASAPPSQKAMPMVILITIVALLFAVLSGFLFSSIIGAPSSTSSEKSQGSMDEINKGQVYGVQEKEDFPDSTEGTLEKGGLDGEGSHKLVRPGGESQTAYLTSSTLDLDKFVGRKVKVWGQTYEAQKAGWFMDVGRAEVLE